MKYVHHIFVSVFSHEKDNENLDVLFEKFVSLFPFNVEEEKLVVSKKSAQGFNEKKIFIFELGLHKERHTTRFLWYLKEQLSADDMMALLNQLESRLDEELNFFLRIDKKEYLDSSIWKLTDSGQCFHIKMSVAAFPKKREKAVAILSELFQ